MNNLLKKIQENRQEQKKKNFKIGYSRILTNKMTIVAWRLFKSDRKMHFGLILYRLKRDFGFTEWELANLTGIPVQDLHQLIFTAMTFMKSDALKVMAKFDYEKAEDEWRSKPAHGKPQGYFVIKDAPEWYTNSAKAKRFRSKPDIQFGGETEKELEIIIK